MDFNAALAGLDNAIRARILGDIEVSPPDVAYRTVRGAVSLRPADQSFEGFDSRFVGGGDTVEIDMLDYAGLTPPIEGWLVRFVDDLGAIRVKMLAEPLRPSDVGPRFQSAPLADLDPEDERLP